MKKQLLSTLITLAILSPVIAQDETINKIFEKTNNSKDEFRPIVFDKDDLNQEDINLNSIVKKNEKYIDIKNEFFESIKVVIESDSNTKTLYLKPYENLQNIIVNKKENYEVKVFDISDNYLGNLINIDKIKNNQLKISKFLLYPAKANAKKNFKSEVIETTKTNLPKLTAESLEKKPSTNATVETEESLTMTEIQQNIDIAVIKIESEKGTTEIAENQFKVANISDFKIKITITNSAGEFIGTNWILNNDTYEPELIEFASKPIALEPDSKINIAYLNENELVVKEKTVFAKEITKDTDNNYTFLIGND